MTEPSQRALDYAARKAGFKDFKQSKDYALEAARSIIAHAQTLDELWALKPPKTRGELFADELARRWKNSGHDSCYHLAQMIDEGWEPGA